MEVYPNLIFNELNEDVYITKKGFAILFEEAKMISENEAVLCIGN